MKIFSTLLAVVGIFAGTANALTVTDPICIGLDVDPAGGQDITRELGNYSKDQFNTNARRIVFQYETSQGFPGQYDGAVALIDLTLPVSGIDLDVGLTGDGGWPARNTYNSPAEATSPDQSLYFPGGTSGGTQTIDLSEGVEALGFALGVPGEHQITCKFYDAADVLLATYTALSGAAYGAKEYVFVGHAEATASITKATLYFENVGSNAAKSWVLDDMAIVPQLPNAPNIVPYEETFEAYASGFKMSGMNGWSAAEPAGAVVSACNYFYSRPCGYPVGSANHATVLEISGMATNSFSMDAAQVVWVDMMLEVGVGPSVDTSLLETVQAAIRFNDNGHPLLYHFDVAAGTNRWTEIPETTKSGWVRATLGLDYLADYFQVKLDGNLLTNALAWTSNDGSGSPGGSWFAMPTAADRINRLVFGGNGASLDDLVVTTGNPLVREVEIVSAHGQADPCVGTHSYIYGDTIALSLTNSILVQGVNQFVCTNWSMSGHAPVSGDGTNITITLTNDLTLAWLWTTNNALTENGTPIWWLTDHGFTIGDDALDGDNDGILTWQEWVADTAPNDSNSVLKITDIEPAGAGMKVDWKGGVQATQVLERCTNLVLGGWDSILTNIPPTAINNSFSDFMATNRAGYYRFKAWR